MSAYERPSVTTKKEDIKRSWWAQVTGPGCAKCIGDDPHHVIVSPGFDSQAELVAWLRPYSTPAHKIEMLRREVRKDSNVYNDHLLEAEEPMTAERKRQNLERLHAIMAGKPLPTMPELLPDESEPF